MSGALIPFAFDATEVRGLTREGSAWFVLNDICAALDLSNPRKAAQSLEDDEKGVTISDTLGGPQEVNIINESGLWSLVLRSRKPEARRFKRWLTSEVIPALRQTGSYGAPALASGESAALQITAMRDAILPEIGEMIAAAMATATAKSLTGALEAVLPGMVRQAIDTSSMVLTRDFVTVGQLLNEQQVPSKGRRGLVSLVAKSLRTWCIARGVTPRERDIGTQRPTYLYPIAEARAWLAAEGHDLIKRWRLERDTGQQTLALVGERRRKNV